MQNSAMKRRAIEIDLSCVLLIAEQIFCKLQATVPKIGLTKTYRDDNKSSVQEDPGKHDI